jgi:hypothetical protein
LRIKGDGAEDEATGNERGSAPRVLDDGDLFAEAEDLDLGPSIDVDPSVDVRPKAEVRWGDHLQTIRDSATFAEKPVHLRLDVTVYPEGLDRVVRVVVDDVTPGSSESQAAPHKTLPPRPAGKFGLRRRLPGGRGGPDK